MRFEHLWLWVGHSPLTKGRVLGLLPRRSSCTLLVACLTGGVLRQKINGASDSSYTIRQATTLCKGMNEHTISGTFACDGEPSYRKGRPV